MNASPKKARDLFLAAKRLPAEAREEYLRAACGEDQHLHQRVCALLEAQAEIGSYHEPPPQTVEQSLLVESPGTLLGPYKLLEPIGEGGMGTVWMAQQIEPVKRLVAVKLIRADIDSRTIIARFEAERQALALMDHPNIAKALDGGTTAAGRPYFVMDLVKGVPITRFCDEHRLTLEARLELFIPVCEAIQHAHQKGIIHRDLKPSNVLVALYDDKPVPKVIDFGVAKATGQLLTEKTLVTGFGNIVGTLEYMAPEQAEFNQLDIDTRSDIYSLGVLLYELLTGSPPFSRRELERAGMLEMLRVIREEEPTKPSTKLSTAEGLPALAAQRGIGPARLTKRVRGELDWIVMKALEKDRSRRYDTATAFALDVSRFLADQPVQACPPSVSYRLRKFVRRNRTVVGLSGCLTLLAAAIAIGGWFYGKAAEELELGRLESTRVLRVKEAHEKIPVIQAAIRQGQYLIAFDLLKDVEPVIPDHPDLPELWQLCSHPCTPTTNPAGADLWLRPYDQPDAPWRQVIQTTDRPTVLRVPRGEYLWRATKEGYREVTGLRPPTATSFTLDPEEAIPPEMVRVPEGSPNRPGMAFSVEFRSVQLPAFLVDRYEVTNSQYDRFVQSGGYERPDYWQDLPFVDQDGKARTWADVKSRFVDQTGRPGPATWRNGTFPAGEDDYPVRGVSWYEAAAYARFAGKSLPTIYHWAQASQIESSVILAGNEFITRSNFGNQVQAVGSLTDTGFFGTLGTMGNVKEWCFNETRQGQRFILGGCCAEPIYVPLTLDSSSPLRRDAFFGFRCVQFDKNQKGPAAAWEKAGRIPWPAPPEREKLLDTPTFRLVVSDRFSYDRSAPLDVTSEQRDEGAWIHVVAEINAAYCDAKGRPERMAVHLYLPKGIDAGKGYQAVVYCPGRDAAMLPRMRPLAEEYGLDALVRGGRAVVRPVFQGIHERRYPAFDADDRIWEERRIGVGQDLMRTIDYLEQRGDINVKQLGYYGFSAGAEYDGSLVAVEPRLRAVVFEAGGLSIEPLRTERLFLEWRHCLPQIRVPVLMLNGQVDPIYPVKESQEPMFQLLGSTIKEHYIHPNGHHMLPPEVKFAHLQRWFDRHLGIPARVPVERGAEPSRKRL